MDQTLLPRLHAAVSAVCPILGVSIGDPADKLTWRIDFADEATAPERAAGQAALDGLDNGPKLALSNYAVDKRWATMNGGLLFDGHPIPTDEMGRGFIAGAFAAATSDPGMTKNWQISNAPIQFVTLSNAQIIALGLAANAMVQSAFDTLKTVGEGIEAETITTTAQIDAAFAAVQRIYTTA